MTGVWTEQRRKKMSETMKALVASGKWKLSESGREILRQTNLRTRTSEKEAASKLSSEYDFIASSNQVCDSIAIKDGAIYLIESKFKPRIRKDSGTIRITPYTNLTPIQARAKELAGDKYRVVEIE